MPRPGPRPYECVKRAWHSEKHHAMRGSVLQQIFRIAHECHRDITKKNKEWLEKLPLVVLKAEEIIYSKANSENEYTDQITLWDRLNDAIDTMIRRDETSESGELLPPCIEAALILGCFPVRASRSQRHSNPRNYLNPSTQEKPSSSVSAISGLLCRGNGGVHGAGEGQLSASVYELQYGNCFTSEAPLTNSQLFERGSDNAVRTSVPGSDMHVCNSDVSPNVTDDVEMDLQCDLSLRLSFYSAKRPNS